MDLQLKGKRALVFGSSAGIGYAVAESLKKEGALVYLNGRNQEKLSKACQALNADGFISGDLTKAGEAKRITLEAIEKLSGLDIIVTNTGGPAKGTFPEVTLEQWQTDYQAIWLSVVETMQTALPQMKEQNYGRILMITSIAAKEPLPGLTTSNGLRAGLAGLAKSVATEYAAHGVTLNLLLPGYTNTERLQNLNLSQEKVEQMVPAGRLGEPRELANLATFLASPLAGYITGQSISVDGGVLKGN
jgi:3-oxoacyl-[acyl-carrier protein] reductase